MGLWLGLGVLQVISMLKAQLEIQILDPFNVVNKTKKMAKSPPFGPKLRKLQNAMQVLQEMINVALPIMRKFGGFGNTQKRP